MKNPMPFMKFRSGYILLSLLAIASLYTLTYLQGGFKLGTDFQPGINMLVGIQGDATSETVLSALAGAEYKFTVQTSGDAGSKEFVLRSAITNSKEDLLEEMQAAAETALKTKFGETSVTTISVEYIGPSLSSDLVFQTILLIGVVFVLILIYIWFRFKLGYAFSAIICLIHDVTLTIGFIGVTQMEFSTALVAALLTLIGYSLNDTIVVFDRIRENVGLRKDLNLKAIIDTSITQSLSRTTMTSFTTLLTIIVLAVVTQGDVKNFAIALLFGIVIGTYSSIAIASPLLPFFKSVRKGIEKEKVHAAPVRA